MHRREWHRSVQARRSPVPYYRKRSRSPNHYLNKSKSPSRCNKRRKSPSHVGNRSEFPSRHSERNNSPSHYLERSSPPHNFGRSKSPSYYLKERASPSHNLRRSGSPSRQLDRSRSPYYNVNRRVSLSYNLERSGSPSYNIEKNEPSAHYLERSGSPSYYMEKSESPHYLERSRSPSQYVERSGSPYYLERSGSPSHYVERSGSPHYLDRNGSPVHFLKRTGSPSYFAEESGFPPHLKKRESPSYYMERSESPSHYLEKSGSSSHNVERSGPPFHYVKESEPPSHYIENESPSYLRSPPHVSKISETHYFSRSKSRSPLPRSKSAQLLDRGESPPRNRELKEREHYNQQHHGDNDYQFDTSKSASAMYFKEFTDKSPDLNRDFDSTTQNFLPSSNDNVPQEEGLKSRNARRRRPKNIFKKEINSLEEADAMSSEELHSFRISGASQKKVRILCSQGYPYLEAKRTVIRQNYIRRGDNESKSQAEMITRSQHHVVSFSVSRESTVSVTRINNEERSTDLGESSKAPLHFQRANTPEDSTTVKATNEKHKFRILEKVSVVHADYPKVRLGFKKLVKIQKTILSAYETIPRNGPQVRFVKCKPKRGFLLITCADKTSADWLIRVAPTLQPWKGARLRTMHNAFKPVRCSVFVPDNDERLSEDRILHRLRVSNRGLDSHLWSTIENYPVDNGQMWVFAMDIESLKFLTSLDMRPFFGFGSLEFEVLDDPAYSPREHY